MADTKSKQPVKKTNEDFIRQIAEKGRTDEIGTFPRDIRLYSMVIARGFLYLGEILKNKG